MHKRQEIRQELQKIFKEKLEGVTVYDSRIIDIPSKRMPAISIYTTSETSVKSDGENNYTRTALVNLALYAKGKDKSQNRDVKEPSVDNKLDDLAESIEDILLNKYETLNGVVYRLNMISYDANYDDDASELFATALFQFVATYRTDLPDVGGDQ